MIEPPPRGMKNPEVSPNRWGRWGALFLAIGLFSALRTFSGGFG